MLKKYTGTTKIELYGNKWKTDEEKEAENDREIVQIGEKYHFEPQHRKRFSGGFIAEKSTANIFTHVTDMTISIDSYERVSGSLSEENGVQRVSLLAGAKSVTRSPLPKGEGKDADDEAKAGEDATSSVAVVRATIRSRGHLYRDLILPECLFGFRMNEGRETHFVFCVTLSKDNNLVFTRELESNPEVLVFLCFLPKPEQRIVEFQLPAIDFLKSATCGASYMLKIEAGGD